MADFNITIGSDSTYQVTKTSETSTECATIYTYNVEALAAESITVTLVGDYDNATYTLNGVTSPLVSPQVIVFDTSLTFSFSIENSGNPGIFYSCDVTVVNTTTIEPIDTFNFTVERANDGTKCASGTLTYDELTDTPSTKVGQALKYIQVSADELSHVYVDAVPGDASYIHTQAIAATSWVIPHALGKYPSVTIQDGSGNTVFGDITYTNISTLTLTFNTAFSGVAYLN
tara:strand:+ start:23740 stop:24429 length:690 start_codon:yes stop_codon:yes gene_type:complete